MTSVVIPTQFKTACLTMAIATTPTGNLRAREEKGKKQAHYPDLIFQQTRRVGKRASLRDLQGSPHYSRKSWLVSRILECTESW